MIEFDQIHTAAVAAHVTLLGDPDLPQHYLFSEEQLAAFAASVVAPLPTATLPPLPY